MKKLIFFLLVSVPALLIAQNWSPIRVNDTMNFTHTSYDVITNSIFVTETSVSGSDSTFYMNKIVTDVPDNYTIVKRNQPQFLSSFLVKEMPYNIWVAAAPYNYMLPVEGGIGTVSSFGNGLTAEITSIELQEVFGFEDSVKTFTISDGSEVLLSKNFGIIKFPDFENGGYYYLAGIQNTQYGKFVPDFWDIFNFEVGDVFQISGIYSFADGYGYGTDKYTVTSKEVTNTGFTYNFDLVHRLATYSWPGGSNLTVYATNTTKNYDKADYQQCNMFPLQLHLFPETSTTSGTGNVFSRAEIKYDSLLESDIKSFGVREPTSDYQGDVFWEPDAGSEILNRFQIIDGIIDPCGKKGYGYGEGLGITYNFEGCFEYSVQEQMVGYVKEGDTTGTITPDSLLLLGVSETATLPNNFSVFPNPAKDYLKIKLLSGKNIQGISIEFKNLIGDIVLRKEIADNAETIDISRLQNGLYVYTVYYNGKMLSVGKVVIAGK